MKAALAMAALLSLSSCVTPRSPPLNRPLAQAIPPVKEQSPGLGEPGGVIVLFSGGGARSAAFGYGVLDSLSRTVTPKGHSLAEAVDVAGGVSGGGVLAAYFALRGAGGLSGFRSDFLDADPEKALSMRLSPANLLRGYRGGMNDISGFPVWLDRHLYKGARLGDVGDRPRLVLHATDLYNRMPFFFDAAGFAALCSDYRSFPLSVAVAASAAVPVAFAPVVLSNYRNRCPGSARSAVARGPVRPGLLEQEFDRGTNRIRSDPSLQYLKLYDGGLVDGTGAFALTETLRAPAPSPLQPARAREIRHLLVIVVDASTRWGGTLSRTETLPNAPDTLVAAIDAMINIPNIQGVDRLRQALTQWRKRLADWRCQKKADPGCTPPSVDVARIALSDIEDPALLQRILTLHNRFSLKRDDVDFLSRLGESELKRNPDYRRFLSRIGARHPPV